MLQVDVSARATMDQILRHPWMTSHNRPAPPIPLMSKLAEIPHEDRDTVLHRMEQGNFGSRDNIIRLELWYVCARGVCE